MAEHDYAGYESVRSHIPRAVDYARTVLASYYEESLAKVVAGAESPIEAVFMLWWDVYSRIIPHVREHLELHPQFGFAPINGRNYRADFVVWPRCLDYMSGSPYRAVVVELDGHDFHERTKEQVAARNQRDRDLQDKNYIVRHFSGSELFRSPGEVLNDVITVALEQVPAHMAHEKACKAKAKADE